MEPSIQNMLSGLERKNRIFAAAYPEEAKKLLGKSSRNILRWISQEEKDMSRVHDKKTQEDILAAERREYFWMRCYFRCVKLMLRTTFLQRPLRFAAHKLREKANMTHRDRLMLLTRGNLAAIRRLDACYACYYRVLAQDCLRDQI